MALKKRMKIENFFRLLGVQRPCHRRYRLPTQGHPQEDLDLTKWENRNQIDHITVEDHNAAKAF